MTVDASSAQASRAKEFFKGFFWPSLFILPGLATYWPFLLYDEAHQVRNGGSEAIPAAVLCLVVGSLTLIVRWWKRRRWRAWGVIAGFFAAPPLVVAAVILLLMLFKVQIAPR